MHGKRCAVCESLGPFLPELCGSSVRVVCFLPLVASGSSSRQYFRVCPFTSACWGPPCLVANTEWGHSAQQLGRCIDNSLLSPMCFDDEGQVHLTAEDSGTVDRNYARLSFIQQFSVYLTKNKFRVRCTNQPVTGVYRLNCCCLGENRAVRISTLWAQNTDFSNVTAGGTYNYRWNLNA